LTVLSRSSHLRKTFSLTMLALEALSRRLPLLLLTFIKKLKTLMLRRIVL